MFHYLNRVFLLGQGKVLKDSFPISHIKNMYTERLKYEIEVEHQLPLIEDTSRIYKPSYTIEFNREGEVLLYSCEPTKEVLFLI